MSKAGRRFMGINVVLAMAVGAVMCATLLGVVGMKAHAAEAGAGVEGASLPTAPNASPGMAYWAAAASVGVCVIGAGIAVGMTGTAAIAAVAERPELMGRTILFVGLAEGLAIYGLIIAIMILGKV